MPKQVDHDERRRQIAGAVARIAASDGVAGVSFRHVAAEADMSVSLVQHYFGDKASLLIDTLDIQSAAVGTRIASRLEALGDDAGPLDRVRTVAAAFLPDDPDSANAMRVYLGFAGAALTDPGLRSADAFSNARTLQAFLASELEAAASAGELDERVDPRSQAMSMLSLVLGLSLGVLLEQTDVVEAKRLLDRALTLLRPPAPDGR